MPQLKEKTATFEIVSKSMGCLKLAHRSEAEIPIHRDIEEENTVLRCVWNAWEQSKNHVRCYGIIKSPKALKLLAKAVRVMKKQTGRQNKERLRETLKPRIKTLMNWTLRMLSLFRLNMDRVELVH